MNLIIRNIEKVEHRELQSTSSAEKFSFSAVLSDLVNFNDLFVHHEILPAGRRGSSPHTHSRQEEMLLVLEGTPTVHVGSQAVLLRPGDFLGFSPGGENPHFVENNTSDIVRLLVVASKPDVDEIRY